MPFGEEVPGSPFTEDKTDVGGIEADFLTRKLDYFKSLPGNHCPGRESRLVLGPSLQHSSKQTARQTLTVLRLTLRQRPDLPM